VGASKEASCWNCYYRKEKQMSLFGECMYFVKIGEKPKEIPDDIVNKGCKYHILSIIHKIITVFDGKPMSPDE
jgi:hypothetical protein